MPHLGLIFKDGTVLGATISNDTIAIQGEMLNLVDDETYFGLSYGNSIIFITSTIKRQITLLNPFDGKFKTLPFSSKLLENSNNLYFYSDGIQVGDKFWVLNRNIKDWHANINNPFWTHETTLSYLIENTTAIWYIKKSHWTRGPILKAAIEEPFSVTAINRSS